MTKQEFLDNLRRALTGKVDTYKANDTIQYYSDYIEKEIRNGKTEAEVLESLGDPRLLVRTMISAENAAGEFQGNPSSVEYTQDESESTGKIKFPRVNKLTLILVIIAVIAILVLVLMFKVVIALWPVLLPVILILAIIKIIDKS